MRAASSVARHFRRGAAGTVNDEVLIRASREDDMGSIAAIYSHHVLHGTASFETSPPSSEEMARRRADLVARNLPHLVAELGGEVVGYAYAGPYRTREAYRFTLEDSVYIHPDYQGKGIGRRLLHAVIREAAQAGYRQMIAVIGDSGNVASIRLHETAGFRHMGVLRSVGYKFDRWLDTVLMQLDLVSLSRAEPSAGALGGDRPATASGDQCRS